MAGTIHGINNLTEFALYEQPDQNGRFLGFFAVRKTEELTSTLRLIESMSPPTLPAYAVPTKVLRVAFSNKPGISAVTEALRREVAVTESKLYEYSFVHRDQAAVEVDISEGWVVFNNVHPRVQALGYSRMPYRVKMGETQIIRGILEAASNFELLLNLAPEDRGIRDRIRIEFTEITRPRGEDFGPAIRHEDTKDLCRGDFVEVTAGDTIYGIKITNNSPFQLYPHLFLFDCSDLSIRKEFPIGLESQSFTLFPESYYKPLLVMAKDEDGYLKPDGGVLTIGYGADGGQPWSHYLRDEDALRQGKIIQEEQHLDVNVFKLFLTTKLVDLSCIEQEAPFLGSQRAVRKPNWGEPDAWDTLSLFVSIRR
jgi:hypothetical protein